MFLNFRGQNLKWPLSICVQSGWLNWRPSTHNGMSELGNSRAPSAGWVMTHNADDAPGTRPRLYWVPFFSLLSNVSRNCARKCDIEGQSWRVREGVWGGAKEGAKERVRGGVKEGVIESERGSEKVGGAEPAQAYGFPQWVNQRSPDEGI